MMRSHEPLRILYVWDADYPWDVRTEKVCLAMKSAGMDVHIAARNRSGTTTTEHLPEGVVHRMKRWPVMNGASGFPAFFNPRWITHLHRVIKHVQPHLIVVRDLPLCPTAQWVGRHHKLPVVLDMAENYPAMLADLWLTGTHRPWDVIVRNPAIVRAVESRWIPRLDHILVVVEESADRLTTTYDIAPERITIVSNTPPRNRVNGHGQLPPGDRLNVVYLGLMELPRGVGDLIEAQAFLKRDGLPVRIRLVGSGRDMRALQEHAAQLGLDDSDVEFMGRMDHADALRVVGSSDVGIVPHHANESWNTTVPNKLFDYMAAGIPVVSSDAVPCRRIIQGTESGLIYRSGQSAQLAESIKTLLDPQLRSNLGRNGRRAVLTRFNWEDDSQRLVDSLQHIVSSVQPHADKPARFASGVAI